MQFLPLMGKINTHNAQCEEVDFNSDLMLVILKFRNTGATVSLRNVWSTILKQWNRCSIL